MDQLRFHWRFGNKATAPIKVNESLLSVFTPQLSYSNPSAECEGAYGLPSSRILYLTLTTVLAMPLFLRAVAIFFPA
jgi:hypothetical protein